MTACLTNLLVKWLPHSGGEALPAPGAIVGVCEDMCPAAERARREHLHDIQIFERVDINDSGRTSAELAVRRFARTVCCLGLVLERMVEVQPVLCIDCVWWSTAGIILLRLPVIHLQHWHTPQTREQPYPDSPCRSMTRNPQTFGPEQPS